VDPIQRVTQNPNIELQYQILEGCLVNPDIQQANALLESVQKAPSIVYKVNKN